jgi:hypothetical protein
MKSFVIKTHIYAYFQRRQIQTEFTVAIRRHKMLRRGGRLPSVAGDGRASEYGTGLLYVGHPRYYAEVQIGLTS